MCLPLVILLVLHHRHHRCVLESNNCFHLHPNPLLILPIPPSTSIYDSWGDQKAVLVVVVVIVIAVVVSVVVIVVFFL